MRELFIIYATLSAAFVVVLIMVTHYSSMQSACTPKVHEALYIHTFKTQSVCTQEGANKFELGHCLLIAAARPVESMQQGVEFASSFLGPF